MEALGALLGSNILGALIKHVIPGRAVNKFIPIINMGASSLYYKYGMGLDWGSSVGLGVTTGFGAKGSHATVRGKVDIPQWWSKTGEKQGL